MSSSSSETDSTTSSDLIRQREFEQAVEQLQLIISVVALPFIGKWFGRKFSFWIYSRYRVFGWTWDLLFGPKVALSARLS
ncbi:hypothetical protein E3P99_00906 [Wallemia hederae]|uniref:Uncharacterized protein n=1 Tax=Wallemia hederae TaxID=1540922 RepID=A0A4T0FTZ3_9BASI|nr:hypothetical protein E3P99_00906 [Wallemia hederae]